MYILISTVVPGPRHACLSTALARVNTVRWDCPYFPNSKQKHLPALTLSACPPPSPFSPSKTVYFILSKAGIFTYKLDSTPQVPLISLHILLHTIHITIFSKFIYMVAGISTLFLLMAKRYSAQGGVLEMAQQCKSIWV